MYFPEGLENTPLTLLSNVKFYVEDFFKLCGLLRISELYCAGITKPHEIIVNIFSVSVAVSFSMLPYSKGHLIRAYLDTI